MTTQKDRIEAAIRHIQTSVDIDQWAMELAVDALKAQGTCEDAVSRQTLQKELALYPIDDVTSDDEAGYNRAINDVQKMVLHLPSAQPEQRWIPVTERLPEEDGCYLVTTTGMNNDIIDIAYYTTGLWHKASQIKAWMPLPELYKEGEQNED